MNARRWTADGRALDGAAAVIGVLLTGAAVRAHWSALAWPLVAAAGVLGSVALWWRRSWPVTVAVVGALAYAVSANPWPWLVGVYSGASYARRRWVALVAVVGFAGFLAREWWEVGHILANDVLSAAEAAAVVTGVGLFVATRRALTASWRDRAERAEAERLLSEERTRSAERTRIAREMHDVVAHKVSLIALHAGALELTADAGPDRVRDEAGLIRVTAREALQELRQVLGVLRADPALPAPDHADPAGPGEAFADVTTLVEAAVRAGQPVELDDRAGALPPATARVVYRIVQEGLTNARKHAPGAAATVVVDRVDNGQVSVTVDNAAPTRPPLDLPGSGAGLVGLAERVRLAGGRLAAGPGPAGGWRLQAAVPPAEPAVERAVKPARAGSTVEDS